MTDSVKRRLRTLGRETVCLGESGGEVMNICVTLSVMPKTHLNWLHALHPSPISCALQPQEQKSPPKIWDDAIGRK